MSSIKFLVVTIAFSAVAMVTESAEMYSTAFDSLDVNEILTHEDKLTEFCKCLLDEGTCSESGEQIKLWIANSLEDQCKRCSEKQKENAKKIIKYLFANEVNWWQKLEAKYDPKHVYRQKYIREMLEMKH